MKQLRWILMALLLASVGCVSQSKYQTTHDQLLAANRRIQELEAIAMESGEGVDRLGQEASKLRSNNDSLAQQLRDSQANAASAARRISELQSEVAKMNRAAPPIPGVDIISEGNALTYRVDGSLLFDPGKTELKSSGKKTLEAVASQLKAHNYKIEVAGHTDTDPVSATKQLYPRGNIELASDRALSVWSSLKDSGVQEERMIVSSYGQYLPVNPADKAQNRRVEIRVLLGDRSSL